LTQLKISEAKALLFVKKVALVTGSIAGIELVLRIFSAVTGY
jgi:hypothetical protein